MRTPLIEQNVLSQGQQADISAKATATVQEAVAFWHGQLPTAKRFIPDSKWPQPEDLLRHVRVKTTSLRDVPLPKRYILI